MASVPLAEHPVVGRLDSCRPHRRQVGAPRGMYALAGHTGVLFTSRASACAGENRFAARAGPSSDDREELAPLVGRELSDPHAFSHRERLRDRGREVVDAALGYFALDASVPLSHDEYVGV